MLYFVLFILSSIGVVRAAYLVSRDKKSSQNTLSRRKHPCKLAVFLGSGGHTSEAITLVSSLDFSKYTHRTYVISEGDSLSAKKAAALETFKSAEHHGYSPSYSILVIPRARRVHQPLITTPPTALYSFLYCIYHITIPAMSSLLSSKQRGPLGVDVLLVNGPGTCSVLCGAVFLNRFLGLSSPRIIYVESFARVNSLSLSGKILRPFVDRFVVQWPNILRDGGRGETRGWLV